MARQRYSLTIMNDLLARILQTRLLTSDVLKNAQGIVVGLVKSIESDSFTGGKKRVTLPVPVAMDSRQKADYKLLLPDPQKSIITYFEDGGYRRTAIAGKDQIQSRLTLVCWYNGQLMQGLTNEKLMPLLVSSLTQRGRSIPTTEPGVCAMTLNGYSQGNSDPFAKYSAYRPLFAFKDPPYNWFSLDLSLTAYIDINCIIQ